LSTGAFGSVVAFDQDRRSLDVVAAEYGHLGVRTQHGSVRDIITGAVAFAGFDLVYATGLYDYVLPRTARRLTEALLAAVVPGGRLVLANYMPGTAGVAYIESFMDWHLVYRTEDELTQLHDTSGHLIDAVDLVADPEARLAITVAHRI